MAAEDPHFNIIFAVNGTRGDFQPFLSLARVLMERGHRVRILTAENHAKNAVKFGVDAQSCSPDVESTMMMDHVMRAMEKGDFATMLAGKNAITEEMGEKLIDGKTWEELLPERMASYMEFRPQLYLTNTLGDVPELYFSVPDVPKVDVSLQPQGGLPSNSYKQLMWARQLPEPDTPLVCTHIWPVVDRARKHIEMHQWAEMTGAPEQERDKIDTAEEIFSRVFEQETRVEQRIYAFSPNAFVQQPDWPPNLNIVGNLKLTSEEQSKEAEKGNAFFTSGTDHEACAGFLAAGPAPVYVGWGSMIVYGSKHMTLLAVEALHAAGQRGIIVSGWAKLSRADLDDSPQELRDFADRNVLFMKTAPHEWLFPQCQCCVHHGGIGTVQASLGAGVPTVITPVFADQEGNTAILEPTGCVIGTTRLGKLTSRELGEAVRRICSDPAWQERARELGARMQKEDGCGKCAEFIERFMKEEVITGKYKKDLAEQHARLKALHEKNKALSADQVLAQWNIKLNKKFPAWKDYNRSQIVFAAKSKDVIDAGRCWWVKGSSCLVRAGEDLKSTEVGRFKQYCILEELERKKNGNRLRMRKLRGYGPEEGWISPAVSGKDMIDKVSELTQLGQIQMEQVNKLFADVLSMNKDQLP